MAELAVNAQYNVTAPDSLAQRVAHHVRRQMFATFMKTVDPGEDETVLDIGVTSDQSFAGSNYFEELYPYKGQVTAAGVDDARFLESRYPGIRFIEANILDLPFADGAFDIVHVAAVWEHVGSRDAQRQALAECLRVARRAVCLTTPNRWFPVELHTAMPLLHWLPPRLYRRIYRMIGLSFFAEEANLNLLDAGDIRAMTAAHLGWRFGHAHGRLLGLASNLILFADRIDTIGETGHHR